MRTIELLRKKTSRRKQVILGELKEFLDQKEDIEGQKEWQKTTDEVLKFQSAWKKIGFAPKKENDAIWKEFRALCDSFLKEKKNIISFEIIKINKLEMPKKH